MKTAIFVVPTQVSGKSRLRQRVEAFLLPFSLDFDTNRTVSNFFVEMRSRVLRLIALAWVGKQSCFGTVFFIFGYSRSLAYTYTHLNPNKAMRPTSIVLDELRDRVSNASDYVETKKLLSDVFLTYFASPLYTQAHDVHQKDATFMAVLLNDLLDELFLQNIHNPINKRPCNN